MSGIGPFVVAAFWAFGSAQLFVQGWLAAADLVIAVIALLRGRMAGPRAAQALVASWITDVVCSVLLRLGYDETSGGDGVLTVLALGPA